MKRIRVRKPRAQWAAHGWRCCPLIRGTQTLFAPRPWPSPTVTRWAAAGGVGNDGGQPYAHAFREGHLFAVIRDPQEGNLPCTTFQVLCGHWCFSA